MTGAKPCYLGHPPGRDASGHCKVCRNEWKKEYYRRRKSKRNQQRRRWRARSARRAEIQGAKESLLSAHRLRAIGVNVHITNPDKGFDSWKYKYLSGE